MPKCTASLFVSYSAMRTPDSHDKHSGVQCKVLSVTSGRTQGTLLALKGCTNEATVNIHYRRSARYFFCTWPEVKSLSWTRRTVEILTLLLRILRIPQIEGELQVWKRIFRKKCENENTSLCVKFIIFLGRSRVLVGWWCVWGFGNWKTRTRI